MELAARKFARNVLAIHVVLMVVIVVLVWFAAREVYNGARTEAINQATKRQELLASQTAHGIEAYYNSILDTLELLRRTEESVPSVSITTAPAEQPPAAPRRAGRAGGGVVGGARSLFASVLWQQLKNRASSFFIVDRADLVPGVSFPAGEEDQTRKIIADNATWLRNVSTPTISKRIKVGNDDVNLVCVPVAAQGNRMFVAVVPLQRIKEQFLDERMSAMLLDQDTRIMAAPDDRLVGLSITSDTNDPQVGDIARKYLKLGRGDTVVIDEKFKVGTHQFESGLTTLEAIEFRDGKRWWLTVGSSLDEVDSVTNSTFSNALRWAIFVVISMTAVLVSTALTMIRSRARLERMRHDILTRELEQARQIQLAWLPRNDDDPEHVDLTAINRPASHISGDFYNWFDIGGGKVCVVIGDVTGHGMAAAFLMATTQLLVRMIMPRVLDAARCMREVNRQLCQQVFSGQFVTMQILVLDHEHHKVHGCSAGHPSPLISSGGAFESLKLESNLVLGVEKEVDYKSDTFELPDGASLVLYTDGVIEAQNPAGQRFEIEGLSRCISGTFPTADAIADCVLAAVDAFRGPRELADDLTLVAIQLQPAGAPAEAVPEAAA